MRSADEANGLLAWLGARIGTAISRGRRCNWAALALFCACCTIGGCGLGTRGGPDAKKHSLQVVHVCGQRSLRAGTPIGGGLIVSLLESSDLDPGDLVVDAAPAVLTPLGRNVRRPDSAQDARLGYVRVFNDNTRSHPHDEPCSSQSLLPGQPVCVAGFVLSDEYRAMPKFLTAAAVEVSGMIIARGSSESDSGEMSLIWVSVPSGDYSAFIGGPVAIQQGTRERCVFAIVVFQELNSRGDAGGAILAALPLNKIL